MAGGGSCRVDAICLVSILHQLANICRLLKLIYTKLQRKVLYQSQIVHVLTTKNSARPDLTSWLISQLFAPVSSTGKKRWRIIFLPRFRHMSQEGLYLAFFCARLFVGTRHSCMTVSLHLFSEVQEGFSLVCHMWLKFIFIYVCPFFNLSDPVLCNDLLHIHIIYIHISG